MRFLLILRLTLVGCFGSELTMYVGPAGNDDWSGNQLLPEPAKGKGPVRTITRALERARAADPASRPVTILLSPGRHELRQPIVLTPNDSGLVIACAGTTEAILSGGVQITNWQRDANNSQLWHADIPAVRERKWNFRELFVDGKRKTRARTPNEGYYRIDGPSSQDKPMKLKFKSDEIKAAWAERGDVELVAYFAWSDIRMQIRGVDSANHVATLSGDPRPSNREDNAQYFLENAPEFLDSPGEWYLDTKTGRVSYWAEGNKPLGSAEVIAPLLEELVMLRGEPNRPVRNITFRNIEFSHADWTLGPNGYADTQAAVAIRGDFRAEVAEDCVIQDCTFSHLAGYAIDLGRGCKRFKVVGNEIVDLGGGGIRIGEPARPKSPSEENHTHIVTDNHLHDLGRVYPPAVGILIMQSGTNRIAHNDIHDLYYTAISVGWNWGYQETPCRENVIEFNHLHDIGQNRLSDMGAVYTLGIQRGTVIRNNLIHDVSAFTYGGWGLYTDEGSSEILLEGNLVYRCKSAGFHQHYGRDNIVRNNIFAFNRESQLMRTRAESHISFIFTNNIVYFDSGNLLASDWSNDNYVMNHNLYFDARLGLAQEKMNFAGMGLEGWRKQGHDQDSKLADPNFVDPGKGDFRLKTDSPAPNFGFKPLNLSTVGPRPRSGGRP